MGDFERLGVDSNHRAVVARFVCGGFLELMTSWLDRPSGADARALANTFQRLTDGVLSSIGPVGPQTRGGPEEV